MYLTLYLSYYDKLMARNVSHTLHEGVRMKRILTVIKNIYILVMCKKTTQVHVIHTDKSPHFNISYIKFYDIRNRLIYFSNRINCCVFKSNALPFCVVSNIIQVERCCKRGYLSSQYTTTTFLSNNSNASNKNHIYKLDTHTADYASLQT